MRVRCKSHLLRLGWLCCWLCTLVSVVPPLRADDGTDRFARNHIIRSWDVDEGFPFIAVTSLAQTPDGYLWIGSFSGLARFDGERFYGIQPRDTPLLDGRMVISLLVDAGGRLWVGTSEGILSMQAGVWRYYGADDGVPAGLVLSLALSPAGEIHATVENRLVQLQGERFADITPHLGGKTDRQPRLCFFDHDGKLWLLDRSLLACRLDTGWREIRRESDQPGEGAILGGGPAQAGGVWVADATTIRRWAGGAWRQTLNRAPGSRHDALRLCEDERGNLWTAGYNYGVAVYQPDGGVLRATTAQGLNNNATLSVFRDDEGNIWLGSNGGGLARARPRSVVSFDERAGITQPVVNAMIEAAPGRLLVATHGGGLLPFDGRQFGPALEGGAAETLNDHSWVQALVRDHQGALWIGAYGKGLFRLQGEQWEHWGEPDLGSTDVYGLLVDSTGRLWVGTSRGIACREQGRFKVVLDRDRTDARFHALAEDRAGRIWAASRKLGLWRLEPGGFRPCEELSGHRPGPVSNLHADRAGNLWLLTASGEIYRQRGDGWIRYGSEQGLPDIAWSSLVDDDQGNLWGGTDHGLIRVSRDSLDAVTAGEDVKLSYQIFDRGDGMRSATCRDGFQPIALRAGDGRLWFATIKGLAMVDPTDIRMSPHAPRALIEAVRDGDDPLPLPRSDDGVVQVPAGTRRVNIRYTGVDLSNGEDVNFLYRLDGIDTDWVRAGIERVARLPDLRPGKYTFHVRAMSREALLSNEAVVELRVAPFYWQTWWFKGGGVLLLTGLVAGGVWLGQRWRLRRAHERLTQEQVLAAERARSARVQEEMDAANAANRAKSDFLATMSHEIRTPLNGVIGSADMLMETALNSEQREHMTTLRAAAEALLAVLNDILDFSKIEAGRITIEETLFDLSQPLREVMEVLMPRAMIKGVELVLDLPPDVPLLVTGDSARLRQILLNLVGNAVKFTERGHILLRVTRVPEVGAARAGIARLRFSVSDTGMGIAPEVQPRLFERFSQADTSTTRKYGGTGLGLAICKRLVELMGGTINVRSTPGRGADFFFELDLPAETTPPPHAGPHPQCVLVLDDLAPATAAAVALLNRSGIRAEAASDPAEALRLLAEREGTEDSWRAILLDESVASGLTPAQAGILAQTAARTRMQIILLTIQPVQAERSCKLPIATTLRKPLLNADPVFEILAAHRTEAPGPDSPESARPARAAFDAHVLVTDDDAVNRLVITKQLEQLGCTVDRAHNGAEAVALARLHSYRIIFMDCRMPEMDGYTATREIRRALRQAPPIIAITANTTIEDRNLCTAAGMVDFISKPVRKTELQRVLERWLKRQPIDSPDTTTGT